MSLPPDDRAWLIAAAYLHDVGYSPDLACTGFHALDGAGFLRGEGQERLAALVAHHSGAGHEALERRLSASLATFPQERSRVADALTYCDVTTSFDGKPVSPEARLIDIKRRHGADHVVARLAQAAWPAIVEAVERTELLLTRADVRFSVRR